MVVSVSSMLDSLWNSFPGKSIPGAAQESTDSEWCCGIFTKPLACGDILVTFETPTYLPWIIILPDGEVDLISGAWWGDKPQWVPARVRTLSPGSRGSRGSWQDPAC